MADVDRKLADLRRIVGLDQPQSGAIQLTKVNEAGIAHDIHSAAVLEWLRAIGIDTIEIDWSAETLLVYGTAEIGNAQTGYSSSLSKAGQAARNPAWPEQYLVIATVISDPFVADKTGANPEILFAKHGTGRWDFCSTARSIDAFAAALFVWANLYYKEFAKSILDAEYAVSQRFKDRLVDELDKLQGVNTANFMKTVDE